MRLTLLAVCKPSSLRSRPISLLILLLFLAVILHACAEGSSPKDVDTDTDLGELDQIEQSELDESPDENPDEKPDELEDLPEVIEALELFAVVPPQGSVEGNTVLALRGKGFVEGSRVFFGDSELSPVTFVDSSQLSVSTPSTDTAGPVDVRVSNPDGSSFTLEDGFLYLAADVPSIDDCALLQLGPFDTLVNSPLKLEAVVFVEGETDKLGQAPGIIGELGWGAPSDAPTAFDFIPMEYSHDANRAGNDQANDAYAGLLSLPTPGTFRFAARFRLAQDPPYWVYCDGDGSANGVQPEQLGQLNVSEPFVPKIGRCALEAQGALSTEVSVPSPELRATVFAESITDSAGRGTGIIAELGYGLGTEPNAFQYKTMAYLDDSNAAQDDRYATTLLIEEAGSYRYAARFALQSEPEVWTYCTLDSGELGTLEVTAAPQPFISYCSTETLLLSTTVGNISGELLGLVQISGVTSGAGQGAGVEAELVWGAASQAPQTWSNIESASYKNDADGSSAGDRARDRYRVRLTPNTAGEYGFYYRFRLNGSEWMRCDTDGSTPSSPFEDTKTGSFVVTEELINLPDWCSTHAPVIGDSSTASVLPDDYYFGRVKEAGMTTSSDGAAALRAELWYGPPGADPRSAPTLFSVLPAALNPAVVGEPEDEYMAAIPTAGEHAVYFRFSVDEGQHWRFCDLDGSSEAEPFSIAGAAAARVSPTGQTVDTIDYCRVWQTSLDVGTADPAPIVTVEVYESSLTAGGNGSNAAQIVVEFGYGAASTNPALEGSPALPGEYQWRNAPFARIANPNNYEYETTAYQSGSPPPVGSYGVVARARRADTARWTYCDTDPTTMDFQMGKVSTLLVR